MLSLPSHVPPARYVVSQIDQCIDALLDGSRASE